MNAVLVELSGGDEALAHDIAVHIAFARPEYLRREDVPTSWSRTFGERRQRSRATRASREAALDKIVEGRLQGWYKERVLLDQPYVRDEKQTIGQLLGGAELIRFAQAVVGS